MDDSARDNERWLQIDDETAAKVLEPFFTSMIDQMANAKGMDWLRSRLPLDCVARLVIESDGKPLASAHVSCRVSVVDLEH